MSNNNENSNPTPPSAPGDVSFVSPVGIQSAAGLPQVDYAQYYMLRLLSQEFTQKMQDNQAALLQGQTALQHKLYRSEEERVKVEEIVKQAVAAQPRLDKWADYFFAQLQSTERHIDNVINIFTQSKERQRANLMQDMRKNLLKEQANQDIVKGAEETVKNKGKTPPVK